MIGLKGLVFNNGPTALQGASPPTPHISPCARCDAVQADELSATAVSVLSDGGHVHIQRLHGIDVEVDSSKGDVSLRALYGTRANITSSGGSVSISHVSCSGLVAIHTNGGSINVKGLEGNASLISGGGSIEVSRGQQAASSLSVGP